MNKFEKIDGAIDTEDLLSEIINNKQQLIFKVEQSTDYVYPDEEYQYIIYCHNVSSKIINNIHIQAFSPENILLDEDDFEEGIPIGSLKRQESHLLKLKARCSTVGEFTIHFLCYGDGTGLFTQTLTINCDYDTYNNETTHRIHVYNFTPYEEKYILESEDYNETTTRLQKIQKLPWQATHNPFKIIKNDPDNGLTIDESKLYLDQKEILYGDPYNTDEHNYQYIDRENFNKSSVEVFEGQNLIDIINQINDKSKLFKAKFLKTGSNRLLNDFRPYSPNGFIYRFGLMSSELYHYLGVLPEYSYMNDVIFRWAPDENEPLNLYPKKVAMHWDTKKWAGHGYHVYKTYTDEYKQEIIYNNDFKPLFEFVHSFDLLESAKEYINKEYESDMSNIYYINSSNSSDGMTAIRKYQYIIKESYFDTGVFYVHIPLSKIPSNFYIPSTEELEAIIEKTKPLGMKPLIRFISNARFRHNMSFKAYPQIKPITKLSLGKYDRLRYTIESYKYNNVTETVCYKNENDELEYITRDTIKLIPDGKMVTNKYHFDEKLKLEMNIDEPLNSQGIEMDMNISNSAFECELDNKLSKLSDLNDLLYQNNFENISFMINNIPLTQIPDDDIVNIPKISAINYKLWIQSLEDKNHSRWWDMEQDNDGYYLINNNTRRTCDFVDISLTNKQIIQPNIETGIGFMDEKGKLYGISAEYDQNLELFNIRYTSSYQSVFKTHKKIISDIKGLAYKIIKTDNQTMVLFFIKKENDEKIEYHYFEHIIINNIKSIFCFIRNETDISSIRKLSNIVSIGRNTNAQIYFNTPQYYDSLEYDPSIIITKNINSWENISRIDQNEHSYAVIHNMGNNIQSVDDIELHFDNINVPKDAIIKGINIKAILETNSNKSIYYSIRNQDGYITQESSINNISLLPDTIDVYPKTNQNTQHYQEQYNIARSKELTNTMKILENKISENNIFKRAINPSLGFLDDIDDYITIKKSYWCELSDFTTEQYSFNDINRCNFVLEGYNHGEEVILSSQLTYHNTSASKTDVRIPSGYFIKYITLDGINNFILDDTTVKFRFKNINDDIDIFNTYLDVEFQQKQNTNISFGDYNIIDIEGKKIVNFKFIEEDTLAYQFLNGFTTKLEFDDLQPGEYYRIYSVVLNVIYQAQSIDLLANKSNFRNDPYKNNFIIVNGQTEDAYLSGMFFDDIPSVYQYESTSNSENLGIELSDTLYQSFIAEHDNITSITLYPNGFVGNPDINLKMGLYTNQGNTPSKLIKEIKISGWTKANEMLNNKTVITYNFNVNNLKIGEQYWLKIEVENPKDNNYYLLRYLDTPQTDFKLLTKINNNLINTFGVLKFQVNSIDLYKSFNNIPISQDSMSNPNVFIGLNRGQGNITNLKIQKV